MKSVAWSTVLTCIVAAFARGDAAAAAASSRQESGASPVPGIYYVRIPNDEVRQPKVVEFVAHLDLLETTPSRDGSHWTIRFLVAAGEGPEILATPGFEIEYDRAATEELRRHEPSPGAVAARAPSDTIPDFPCYRNLQGTFDLIDELVERASTVESLEVGRVVIGETYEKTVNATRGHHMIALTLTGRGAADKGWTTDKGIMYVTCGIHAREYATPELCARWAEALVDGYGHDAPTTSLLDHTTIYLVLQANPDGRAVAEREPALYWRKNTRPGCSAGSYGVDLNRNFPFRWGLSGGSSTSSCASTYRGAGPASEPEVQAIISHMRSVFPASQRKPDPEGQLEVAFPEDNVGVYVDVHSYGRLVIWPWGHVNRKSPNDDALQAAARKVRHFNGHALSGPETPDFLYVASGVTDEFAYGELGACGFTYELGTAFYQDCATFDATIAPQNIPSLTYLASISSKPFALSKGPDVTGIGVAVEGPPSSRTVIFNVTASDSALSEPDDGFLPAAQTIANVSLTFDMHPADKQDGAIPPVLQLPVSSNMGTVEITASFVVTDIAHLFVGPAAGDHIAYVWAMDSAGYEGPVSVTSFAVPPDVSASPSNAPSSFPSASPSATARASPSAVPSRSPSVAPSVAPSTSPSTSPTLSLSLPPNVSPSRSPTTFPSTSPSRSPTNSPNKAPTTYPSASPSKSPTPFPTKAPTNFPSTSPSRSPTHSPTKVPSTFPSASPSRLPTPFPPKSPTPFPSAPPSRPPTPFPTKAPTARPTTLAPTKAPAQAPIAVAAVTLTSEATFNNLEIPDDPTEFIAALENCLAEASGNAGVEGDTTVRVTRINGKPVRRKRFFSRLLQASTTSTVITFEIIQTVEVSGDIATVEQKLRQDVATAYDVKGVNEVLQTEELQEYGDLSLGRIQIDLNDGSTPVMETASPTISTAPTNSPTKRPATDCTKVNLRQKGGKTNTKSKGTKGCKTTKSKTKTTKARANTIKRNNPFK